MEFLFVLNHEIIIFHHHIMYIFSESKTDTFTESLVGSSTKKPSVPNYTDSEKEGETFKLQFPSAHFLACEGPICTNIQGLSLKNVTVSCDNPYIPVEFRFKNKLGRW